MGGKGSSSYTLFYIIYSDLYLFASGDGKHLARILFPQAIDNSDEGINKYSLRRTQI